MTKKKDHTPFILKVVRWYFPKLEMLSRNLAANYFLRLFFKPIRYKAPVKELAIEKQAVKSRFTVGDKVIQFFSWGDDTKPYVIVVHGWAGRATQFRKFIPVFTEAGYRVIGFDGPAHGQSEGSSTTLLEFEGVLKFMIEKWGTPDAIIAHSFGGGASLYAITNGLPVRTQINIAAPAVADEIIKTFLRALNGSWETGLLFKQKLKKHFGKSFEEFTSHGFGHRLPKDLRVLVVHDEDDRDVLMIQAKAFLEVFPSAQTYFTKGLGHNRILKDEAVIAECLDFVRQSQV